MLLWLASVNWVELCEYGERKETMIGTWIFASPSAKRESSHSERGIPRWAAMAWPSCLLELPAIKHNCRDPSGKVAERASSFSILSVRITEPLLLPPSIAPMTTFLCCPQAQQLNTKLKPEISALSVLAHACFEQVDEAIRGNHC